MKKLFCLILCLSLLLSFASCTAERQEDIVILFTNDIHCAIDDGIRLAGVAYYKNYLKQSHEYITLVDCGDAAEGSYLGSVSSGEIIIKAMNAVGYDYAILGNHEFNYGIERLNELIALSDAQYLGCNIKYFGSGDGIVGMQPYSIAQYGKTKIAFVGVTTPTTFMDVSRQVFSEDGQSVYDFSGENLFESVQLTVDCAREEGADYVIVLAHLGIGSDAEPYLSTELAAATNGIDAILDGHSHNEFIYLNQQNKDGDNVILAQTGTKLQSLGQLVITAGGMITVTMVSDIDKADESAASAIESLKAEYGELLNKVVCTDCAGFSDKDSNGIRAVRNSETAIGDMVADGIKYVSGADIAYQNGGGVRSGLPAGDVIYSDVIAVLPYGNRVAVVEVTGAEMLDMLEYFVRNAQPETVDLESKTAIGEEGSYPNMSGITFAVDVTVPSSVIVDDDDMLIGVGETRRISDVKVNGEAIDKSKTYTFASSDYMILEGGSGMLRFLADHNVLNTGIMTDYESLAAYIEHLGGDLSQYEKPQNRITFIGR